MKGIDPWYSHVWIFDFNKTAQQTRKLKLLRLQRDDKGDLRGMCLEKRISLPGNVTNGKNVEK